jgi:hypothetical protein
MVGKELIQGIPASAPARLQARLSARRLPLGLPLHRVLRYAQKTLALRETPRHLTALVWCGSTLHGGPGVPSGYPSSSSLRGPPACTARIPARPGRVPPLT